MNQIETSQEERGQKRPLWRNRDFLLLWSGQNVSVLGSNVSRLAMPLLVLALTHSPAQAGLMVAVRQSPYLLFSLLAGALVDRWNRKITMICCDAVRWLALGSVPLAFALGHVALVHLYIVAFVEGTGYVFFSLAQIAALPQVVEPAHLARAYAFDTITEYVGTLFGPSLGAFIIGLASQVKAGTILAYVTDSISYLVSVVSLLFIRVSFQMERTTEKRRALYKEIAEGLRFLWQERLLRIMVLLTTMVNFLQSSITLIIIVLASGPLHIGVQTLGFVLSAEGVGGVLGGVVAPWMRERLRFGQIILGSVILWTGAALVLALAPSAPLLIAGIFVTGFLWPLYGVTLVTYRLSQTPEHLQGRVNSAFRFLSYGAEPLGAAVGGLLLVPLGGQTVLLLIAGGLAVSSFVAFFTSLRTA
ncbi:MAG: MFS transporter [Ktedonobacteraceae bacterium]